MLCIIDAYTGLNVKQAQFTSKYVDYGCLLDYFWDIYCPALVQFSMQARRSMHTISFVAHNRYFLHPRLCRTPQTFEAFGKLVQAGEYPAFVACQPQV